MQEQQREKFRFLGLNIAYYRKEKGLSQSQLAELVNVSRTHMSRIEQQTVRFLWMWCLIFATYWM